MTDRRSTGANVFGGALGGGWWAGKIGLGTRQYGADLALVARLRLNYTDGQPVGRHRARLDQPRRPVRSDGQPRRRDLRRRASSSRAGTVRVRRRRLEAGRGVRRTPPKLCAHSRDEPVRTDPGAGGDQQVTQPIPGLDRYIYDLGQNMVGVPRMVLTGRPAQTVRIRYARCSTRTARCTPTNLREPPRPPTTTRSPRPARSPTSRRSPSTASATSRSPASTTAPAAADVKGVVWGSDLTARPAS